MAFEHPSGVVGALDRAVSHEDWSGLVFVNGRLVQAAELNEVQTIATRQIARVGALSAKDGDRIAGADIVIEPETTDGVPNDPPTVKITLAAGKLYLNGDVLQVTSRQLTGVPATGALTIGVRLVEDKITAEDDQTLLGLAPGTAAEGEPGAVRLAHALSWSLSTETGAGAFYAVYLVRDGTVIDQAPPPVLSGVTAQIARYDRDANGSYIVDGCLVTALGPVINGGVKSQLFSIGAGTANIFGFKRIREAALRFLQAEDPALEDVAAEPHGFSGPTGGATVIAVSRPPIDSVQAVVVVKRVTETVVRGATANTADQLQQPSVVAIESVVQGGTTFTTADYALVADTISWSPAGAEPAAASTYQVTYLYNASVVPDVITDTTVTVSGGVNGTTALVTYRSKVPRIDSLCLDQAGNPIYVKGISARKGAIAPLTPSTLLKLADVSNDWLGAPAIDNNGTRNYTYDEQRRYFNRLLTVLDQFDRSELARDILEREPVSKQGIFTDNFIDDFYRDQGETQSAAVNRGTLGLAVDAVLLQLFDNPALTLPFVEEIVVSQLLKTSSSKINPYQNFTVLPGAMRLEPPVDYWTETQVEWTSPVTQEFTAAPDQPPGQTVLDEVTQIRQTAAVDLRQIAVAATIEGFTPNEDLDQLLFDGVDVKPAGTFTADAQGRITCTFTIPPNVPVGARIVFATGAAGSYAQALFIGQGTIEIDTLRKVTLVARAAPIPVVVTNVTNVTITNVTQEVVNVINPVTQPVPRLRGGDSDTSVEAVDPLAQIFSLPENRHIIGLNVWLTAIGDETAGLRIQLANVVDGLPGNQVFAESYVSMIGRQVGDKIEARFDLPVFLPNTRQYCFVIMTGDGEHALATSALGEVDPVTQQRVSSPPYVVGPLCNSANRLTWTAVQGAALTFEIVAVRFTATSLTVPLWIGAFDQISDVQLRGGVETPTAEAGFRYELVRASGEVIALAPGQNHQFADFVSDAVSLRAVLSGTALVSPTIYRGTLLIGGRIRSSGTYVSRLFPMGTAVRIAALFAAQLPSGSGVTVEVDAGDGTWLALTPGATGVLGGGWTEPKFEKTSFTASQGRVRLTLTGGPAARPALARLRAYSV